MSIGTAYFGNRILRHVAADMEGLAADGFTGILHTFTENDLAYYRESMGRIVEASHAAGLEVQIAPWGVAQMFGGEAESRFTAFNPDAGQVLDDGRATPAGCPNNPAVRSFVRSWADAAIDTGADHVFWDEPHWVHPEHFGLDPGRWGCRCRHCQDRWAERNGGATGACRCSAASTRTGACRARRSARRYGRPSRSRAACRCSAADLARLYGLPVLLVLDVSGQSQTAAAVAKGFASYDPEVRIAGVVLNRLGSERHRKLSGEAIEAVGLPVVGAILRDPTLTLPERHLGLVQASEHAGLMAHLDRLADMAERSLDIDAILALAAPLAPVGADYAQALQPPGNRIALAQDAAFTYLYPHVAMTWRASFISSGFTFSLVTSAV